MSKFALEMYENYQRPIIKLNGILALVDTGASSRYLTYEELFAYIKSVEDLRKVSI